MYRLSSLTVVLGALLALTACKGPYSSSDVCKTQARSYCKFQYQCCNAVERQEVSGGGSSFFTHSNEEECFEELSKLLCASTAAYAEAEAEGRLKWDQATAEECLRPWIDAAEQCNAEVILGNEPPKEECAGSPWIEGAVENGDTCYMTEECADEEASCVPNESEDPEQELVTAKGTCTPPAGEGESCEEKPCRSELWCDYGGDPATCKRFLANGQPCDLGYQCQSGNCQYDVNAGEYNCQAKKANGEDCSSDDECESEYCDYNNFQCGNRKALGEACTYDEECQTFYCDPVDEVCKPEPGNEENVEYDICLGPQG